jgi:site-specific recombinase XerD
MVPKTSTKRNWTLASTALIDAYTDFMLSRQTMRCTPGTLTFYNSTAGKFLEWLEGQSISAPSEVEARHVRAFLAKLIGGDKSSWTVNDDARAIRTFLHFWREEKYTPINSLTGHNENLNGHSMRPAPGDHLAVCIL